MNTITVHAKDQEGSIQIDAVTGIVKPATEGAEYPEWADGLVCAMLAERVSYYFGNDKTAPRLDRARFEQEIIGADLIAFEDLGWVAVDPEGEPLEVEANAEYRMDRIAGLLGIDRTGYEQFAKGSAFEAEIANDTSRTEVEAGQIDVMSEAVFPPSTILRNDKAVNG